MAHSEIERSKKTAAYRAVADHMRQEFRYIGIGSGTTIIYVVEAIKNSNIDTSMMLFVPTGYQSRRLITEAGLTPIAFDSLRAGALLDVAFDGADEIDDDLNCIKGGGACLYQEKLVATTAKKFICVADFRKLQPRLLTKWPSIPIEVEPLAVTAVRSALKALGSPNPEVRAVVQLKEGPLKTDQGNFIIDAPFPPLLLPVDVDDSTNAMNGAGHGGKWEVRALAKEIKALEGVLSVGIFSGENGLQVQARGLEQGGQKPVAAYFGMADGTVLVKNAKEIEQQ